MKFRRGNSRITRASHKAIALVAFIEVVFFAAIWMVLVFVSDGADPLDRLIRISHPELAVTALIGLVVLVGYLVYRIISRFFSPVSDMIRVAEKITAGDLAARSDVKSGDELQQLSERFNAMVDGMKVELDVLSRKVRSKASSIDAVQAEELGNLKEISEFKQAIMIATAHEFRTPITTIRWNLDEALVRGGMNGDGKKNLTEALIACERLTAVIDDLLEKGRRE